MDSEDALLKVIDEISLEGCRELAIDLEHHSMRSFQGITCLLQMSTRSKDYVIDTLALRTHLNLLGSIFSNPNIVKVLHGCDHDVLCSLSSLMFLILYMYRLGTYD